MCIYCNKIVNTDLKEINESYIEDIFVKPIIWEFIGNLQLVNMILIMNLFQWK